MTSRFSVFCPGLIAAMTFALAIQTQGQIKRTEIPLGDTLRKALAQSSLTGEGAQPFHLRVVVSEPENPQSPYQGTIEEWWRSGTEWRRVVTSKDGMRQTIVMANGVESERDEGDYFPLWLRNFVTALFDPVPNAETLETNTAVIEQTTLPNGNKTDACVRTQAKIGSDEHPSTVYFNVCFDNKGRLKFVGSPRYDMSFGDYRQVGARQIAGRFDDDPESGTHLVGRVDVLEAEDAGHPDLFTSLPTTDKQFRSVVLDATHMEQRTAGMAAIVWPSVRSGYTSGHLAMYISVDAEGQVREAWPLNSDNAGLEDSAREQVRKWKIRPAVDEQGKHVQMDGPLSFIFSTKIESPLIVLSKKEDIDRQTRNCPYNPVLPHGVLPAGITLRIRVSVNEQGKKVGLNAPPVPWNMIHATGFDSQECTFNPFMVDGHPSYYYIDLAFTSK